MKRRKRKQPEPFEIRLDPPLRRKLTKEEMIACETERDHAHLDSNAVTSSLIIVACEQSELEKEIQRLSVMIADARQKHKFLEAKRAGMNRVLNKRETSC